MDEIERLQAEIELLEGDIANGTDEYSKWEKIRPMLEPPREKNFLDDKPAADFFNKRDGDTFTPPKYAEDQDISQRRALQVNPPYESENLQIISHLAGSDCDTSQQNYIRGVGVPEDKFASRHSVILDSGATTRNVVLSNVVDQRNLMILQDNLDMQIIIAKADTTSFDLNADFHLREELIRNTFDIRIRRALKGMYMSMINTTRNEQISSPMEGTGGRKPSIFNRITGFAGGGGEGDGQPPAR